MCSGSLAQVGTLLHPDHSQNWLLNVQHYDSFGQGHKALMHMELDFSAVPNLKSPEFAVQGIILVTNDNSIIYYHISPPNIVLVTRPSQVRV